MNTVGNSCMVQNSLFTTSYKHDPRPFRDHCNTANKAIKLHSNYYAGWTKIQTKVFRRSTDGRDRLN